MNESRHIGFDYNNRGGINFKRRETNTVAQFDRADKKAELLNQGVTSGIHEIDDDAYLNRFTHDAIKRKPVLPASIFDKDADHDVLSNIDRNSGGSRGSALSAVSHKH